MTLDARLGGTTPGKAPSGTAATSDAAIAGMAARLREAEATRVPCDPLSQALRHDDEVAGYAVQEVNTRHALGAGRRLVGRKIGLTAVAVQRQMGVSQPDYGMLFEDMGYSEEEAIPPGRLIQPRIEGEIAFVLGRALDRPDLELHDVRAAVDHAVAAFEIVDSRIRDWRIKLVDTVADNASAGAYVLGRTAVTLDGFDTVGCTMELRRGGQVVSSGAGRDCMGDPLLAALWLARKMVEVGRPLGAGDIVLSGALGPMVPAATGDRFTLTIEGLGTVTTEFAA